MRWLRSQLKYLQIHCCPFPDLPMCYFLVVFRISAILCLWASVVHAFS